MQNQQDFVVGVFKIKNVLSFTRYTKRLITTFDEDNYPIYNDNIQRSLETGRVEKIADFLIEDPEATFPTNLVLHIPVTAIKQQHRNVASGLIEITLDEKVSSGVEREKQIAASGDIYVSIIDGQHRLKGVEVAIDRLQKEVANFYKTLALSSDPEAVQRKIDEKNGRLNDLLNIDLVVSFFIDKSLEYQAMIFATINRTQKRVSESLVYSLFGLTTDDSPQKTALQTTLALNAHPHSPFYNRVKLYGGEYNSKQSPPLSQATMVKSIIDLISENLREAERDRFRSRKDLLKNPANNKFLPFRIFYARNEDHKISDALFYFFKAVRECFVIDGNHLWDFDPETMHPTNILQTTVGFQALLSILVEILRNEKMTSFSEELFKPYISNAKGITQMLSNKSRYPFTSKSRTILFLDLSLAIWRPTSNDDPRLLKLKEAEKALS